MKTPQRELHDDIAGISDALTVGLALAPHFRLDGK